MEHFKVIQGYENYSVSNRGNVINNKSNKTVKKFYNMGYEIVSLFNANQQKSLKVHRLVASAFIPNPQNKRCVDHIDNDKTNNKVSNLRWATHQENCRNRVTTGKSGVKGVYEFKSFEGQTLYNVYIGVNYKLHFIGCFDNIEEAKQARQKKANELFGEFTNQCEKIVKDTKIKVDNIIDEANDELRRLEEEFTSKFGN